MAKNLEANVGAWTGTISVPNAIERDDFLAVMGALRTEREALYIARNGGTVQFVGMPSVDDFELPVYAMIGKELTVGGLFRYANCYPPSIAGIASGRIDVRSLITHRYTLEQCPEAMAFARDEKDKALKVIVAP